MRIAVVTRLGRHLRAGRYGVPVVEELRSEHPVGKPLFHPAGKAGAARHIGVIVHSHLRWDFVWQRPQQIFSRLAALHPVLFLEEPMWTDTEPDLRIEEAHPGVVRVVPCLRQADYPAVDAQCAAVLPLMRRAMQEHALLRGRFDSAVDWFYSPMTAPFMLGRLAKAGVVYDCMDELANFRFAPSDIGERERFLLSRAHVVFTGGYDLYESRARRHSNVHFYGCGVDFEHYQQARLPATVIPPEVEGLRRPILGYFGVIDERLDYELLATLAARLPEASLVMVGPVVKVDPASLPQAANIHWLGQRSYQELPALVKAFDVCLMPFALNDATRFINPTKTLEYMAAGKPIVSSAVPDVVRLFSSVVAVADTREHFVELARRAAAAPDPGRIKAGIDRAHVATWEAIVKGMRDQMLDAIPGEPARRESAVSTIDN